MLDPAAVAIQAQIGLELAREDPLRYRRISSPQVRRLIEWVASGVEGLGHAGNAAAKTEELAALFVRMCRGQTGFDGRLMERVGDPLAPGEKAPHWITLPGFVDGEAWRHWVLGQSYDQMKDSSMRAYLRVIGDWPHEIGWLDKSRGIIKIIRIKPEVPGWSDDPATWSVITFISTENMTDDDVKYVQGARVHSVHGDEMPPESVWREVRARKIANHPLYKAIGVTPEYKHEWEWCRNDFLGCLLSPLRGRVRVQWSVRDNRALSLEDIETRIESYLNGDGTKSDLFDARVDGDFVDVSGSNPLPGKAIIRVLGQCQRGRVETVTLRGEPEREGDDDYRDILPASALFERWLPWDPLHVYLGIADPSRGIDDKRHDPSEFEIWDWTEPMCVGRFGMMGGKGGYLDGDSLGILMDIVGREYRAWLAIETNGGFAEAAYLALRKRRYPWLLHEDKTRSPGVMVREYGWNTGPTTWGEIVGALTKGLNEDSFGCWSNDMVQQWADLREAPDGRAPIVSRKVRHHREAVVCSGKALHIIQSRAAPKVSERAVDNSFEAVLRKEFGRPVKVPRRYRKGDDGPEVWREEV